MCIIAIKTKGVAYPTKAQIENCASNNPDGFAMAWNEGGKLKTYRTMVKKDFIKAFMDVSARCPARDTAMVIHCRIATHGSKGKKNCHCWTGGGYAFAHNGILSGVDNRDDLTDSETFFRDIFLPTYLYGGWKAATKAVKAIIGTSKFAFLDRNGEVTMFGRYLDEKVEGGTLYFSNSSYDYEPYFKTAAAYPYARPVWGSSAYESTKLATLRDDDGDDLFDWGELREMYGARYMPD